MANFRTSLAQLLGVPVSSVVLQVRSGSIVIDVRVFMSLPPASSLLTAASLSGALGVNITNIVSTYTILEILAPSPPPPSPPPPSMPPTEMVRALELLYEATGGNAWRNNDKWLSGEPCVDGWFGVHCCPQALPVLRGDDECTADGGGATGVLMTQGSAACHSGSVTGTALDLATCVVVKVLLPSNNLIGQIPSLIQLPFLQHLDLSGNALTGSLPSAADCFPRLTYLDLTQTRSWDDEGGVTGPVPEWLLGRLNFMAPLRLANNALDDPTTAESAVAIRRLWQRCSTLGAEQCSGVPPIGCSAFNRQGERYEVELDGLGCVRCPTPLEIFGIAGGMAGIVLLLMLLVFVYTRFVRKYPEHAKTHVATIMILVGHLQTLTIIGSLQLGWPLIIQEILASINLPLMGYIPLPCILTDPVLKALLSYAETAVVLLLLAGAWLVARRRRDTDGLLLEREAWAEYILSVLFSLLFTVGLRASVTLFMRYDEDQTRLAIARLLASLLWLFWFFLFWRFRRLLREAREAAKAAAAVVVAKRIGMGEYVVVNGRRGKITTDDGIYNRYKVTFDNGEASGWLYPQDVTRAAKAPQSEAARAEVVQLQKQARRAAEAVRSLTERYACDGGLSHGDFLLWAEKEIDGHIRERLADGTIRLLRCAWLLSAVSDKYLGRDASGRVIMRRRQELPEEAFFTNEEAVALFDGADRSILALSYRWLTALHPDPHGTALSAVRRFLRSEAGLGKCAMFWDFTSLPQKPRKPKEEDTFKRGLVGMGYFYASMCGTAVVQLKDIPPRPSEYDGRMIVFDKAFSEKTSKENEEALRSDLESFGGQITKIAIKAGEAHVTFTTHEQAMNCIAALKKVNRGACTVYNETAYSRDRGRPFSGWCTFEQGSSKLAAAHLNMASRQASKRSTMLPERLKHANASRAKVIDISDDQVRTVDVRETPENVLKETNGDLEKATFVGKGEAEKVKQLLVKLEWSMHMAMERSLHNVKREQLARAQWPLRSQWQLVVWTRHGLLFLVSFAMDCVLWFSPYEARRSARYVFAGLAIAVLGGFWRLQAWRQPYAMRRQHGLEAFLYAVDISAIVLACVYGALTHDGVVQDGFGRLALELGLGALLIVSVVGAALVVGLDIMRERWYIRQWFLDATQFFDVPVVDALRDGAVRLINYAWLLDSARLDGQLDGQLPRVTKVVARLASNEPRSVLIRRLATHCGTSSICITVEAASAASPPPSPPPSPPEVAAPAEVQLERFRHELAEAGLSQLAHAIIEDLGIESVEGLREFTFDELKGHLKAKAGVTLKVGHAQKLKAFLAASPSGTSEGRMPGGPKVAFSAHGLQRDAKVRCNTKHTDAKLTRSLTVKAMTSAQVKKSKAGENDVESPHLDTSSAASSPGSGASSRFHSRRGRDSFAEDLTMEAASKSEHPTGRMTMRSPSDPKQTDTTVTAVLMAAKLRRRAGGDKTRRDLPTPSFLPKPGAVGSGRMDHDRGIVLQDLDSRPAPLERGASATRKTPTGPRQLDDNSQQPSFSENHDTFMVTFHLSTFDEVIPLTAASLQGKAEAVKKRLAELGAKDIKIVKGKPFLPRCQDMPPEAFLPPERAAELFEQGRRSVDVVSYCRRSPGVPDPDGRTLEKILCHAEIGRGADGDRGLFMDFACIPETFACPSWHAPEAVPLRFGSRSFWGPDNGHLVDQGPLTVLKFECDRFATEDEAQVCVDKLVALCEQEGWALASMADLKSLGLQSRGHASVLFHGRYISGEYHFDEGADAGGYMRFRTPGDADAARQDPKLKRMCGGKEPKLMGEHVFENELKFKRGLSVMGSLYASATGTCVLQLTDPPGKLGHDDAPSELVSERTGTVFILELQKLQKLLKLQKSLKELQKKLQKELGDVLLEKLQEELQKKLQKEQKELQKEQKLQKLQKLQKSLRELQKDLVGELRSFFGSFFCSDSLEELQKALQKVLQKEQELGDKSLEELQKALQKELGDEGVLACEKKGSAGVLVVRVLDEKAARAVCSLNERGYPLRRKDRVVYPMYNLRPYGSRGWPTFEKTAASIVLAHITQHKRRGGAQSHLFGLFGVRRDLPPPVAQAEASGPKLINIDVIDLALQLKPNKRAGMTLVDSNKVVGVDPDSPASKAGLRAGDLILAVDGVECTEGVTALKLWKDGAGSPVRKLCIAPREVVVAQSPERLLRECKKNLCSERIFFTGRADRKQVVQLLSDFEDSIAFDHERAKLQKLRTEDLAQVLTEAREARRSRSRKEQGRLTGDEEPTPILHVVPEAAVATKAPIPDPVPALEQRLYDA